MMNNKCRCDFMNRCENYSIKCLTCTRNRNTNFPKMYDSYMIKCDSCWKDEPVFEMEYECSWETSDDSTYETIGVIDSIYDSCDSDF